MRDAYDKITEDFLTPDLQMISSACGIECVRSLLREFGGIQFYIPKLTRLEHFVMHYIAENREKNLKMIAQDLNVSETYLRNLLKKKSN